MDAGSSSSLSPDSLTSLTAGDVLIHSTGVRRDRLAEAATAAGGRVRKAAVAVRKLCEAVAPCQATGAALPHHGPPCAPASASASSAPRRVGSPGPSAGVSSTKGHPERLLSVGNSTELMFLSQMDYPREAAVQEDPSLLLEDNRRLKGDVVISQYATGQKEALRAVLKQKTQNTPVLKEVKVQLLGNASTGKKESVGRDTTSTHREVDSAATIAAATAAAIATTAPLLKVQNDLETKVNSVSALIHKLQEADRQLHHFAEQQTNMKTLHEKPHCHERVSELEKQMNAFLVQRIQHLEKLQEQQMNIQSHLISSAVNTGGLQQIHEPSSSLMTKQSEKSEQRLLTNEVPLCQRGLFPISGGAPAQAYSSQFQSCGINTQKSPLKTPVPRRYAPAPVSKNVKISTKENYVTEKENIPKSTSEGEGRLLEHILNSQEMPQRQIEDYKKAALNSNKMSCHSKRDRDVLEEIRIRNTVDEWIKAISLEIQAEMARNDMEQVKYDQKVPWIKRGQNIKDMKTNEEIRAKSQKLQGCSTKKPLSAAKPLQKPVEENTSKQRFRTNFSSENLQRNRKKADGSVNRSAMVQNEDYLCQVYGKPIYQGHRSTLKKAPYLRFNSPSPKSKLQRPKVIECVRGTKVKSARTQTCSRMQKVVTSPGKQRPLYALAQENQYLFSPSRDVPPVCGPLEGHLIPMAIPLGQTQINDVSLLPAGVVIGKPHPVTVTTSIPEVPPKPSVEIKKPNIAVIEMKSEKKDPPQLSVQVLPNVDIDSISSDSVSINHVLPGSEPALPPVDTVIQTPEDSHTEEEDAKFPGTNIVDVTYVTQDQEEERDEMPEFCEPLLELSGHFKVASPKYNGPLFPPVVSAPQQSTDVLDELIERRETVENKLINWVEQEIMARVISGMYPVQKETVPSVSTSDSEDIDAVTSDIVEVAGGGGFQLFINAGMPVDSEMISHFVNEALSETIATMLGNKQAQKADPATNVLPSRMAMVESLVPTPLPTPQATPPQTPPSEKELPPVKTPESSLSLTEMNGDVHKHEQIKVTGVEIPATTSCVGTPVVTPVNTPPRTTTPSPPASEWVSKAAKLESPKPTNPWEDAELPLEEEKPSPLTEEPFCPKAVEMSVANDEEPEALILPSQQSSARPFELLPCNPQVPSPAPTVSSGQSTQESSLTLTETETETADRPISEGEVLFSYGQVLAARALGGGGLCLPSLAESLSSTLRDANEMDYDPPSEGQVVRRPDKGYHRDPVLTLLAKLNQAPLAAQEGIYHLEDSDDSLGQLSEGQRPRLTKAAERILMGHSVYMDHPTAQTSENRPHWRFRSQSPGQLAEIGEILGDEDTAHGPMLMAELESQPVSNPVLQAAQSSCRVTSLSEDLSQEESQGAAQVETVKPRVIYVRRKSEEMQQEGGNVSPHLHSHVSAAEVSVKLPSMNTDNETQSSIRGDSESSGTDMF
ncbi:protein TALPID3 isoform 5-T5 [Ara ararauna]